MNSDNNGRGFGSFLGTFVMGAATGAAIALLTTPRTGREMRARLKDSVSDMGETIRQIPGAVQEAGAKAVKAGQAAFAQPKHETAQTYNMAADVSKDPKGYSLDNTLPRFTK